MAELENLSIGISADASSASASLSNLARALEKLKTSASGLSQVSSQMDAIATSISGLSAANTSNLPNTINALARLGKVGQQTIDLSGLTSGLGQLTNAVSSANVNLAPGINQFVSAITKLVAVGSQAGIVASQLPMLSNALYDMVVKMQGVGSIDATMTKLVSAIAQLSGAGDKTQVTANNLKILGDSLEQLFNKLNSLPAVKKDVVNLVTSLGSLSSAGSKVRVGINGATSGLKKFSSASHHANSSSKGLASAIGKLYAKFWVLLRAFNGIKNMISYASDLTEVQNVVNMTFAESSDVMERFAQSAVQAFGMNELTAKQIGSRYQAMGVAMGFATDKMADMSTTLTGLAGDMASFYNVSQEDVAKDLESIFTGQTRPLRTYGLDLTQATLQEYAMAKGMQVNFQTMTQAEKTLLRYNYVLEHTSSAQGDFVRTQNTWANQVRLLQQILKQLGSTIGQTFISAFKPVITTLNTVLQSINEFAVKVGNALGSIFGWYIEIPAQGITQELEDAEDYADGTASGLGDAVDNAKKLKSQLQSFDELNNISTNDDTGKSGSSSGGGSTSGAGSNVAQIVAGEGLLKKYESEIENLRQLGEMIGKTLQDAMDNIAWDDIYAKASDFGSGLANFLNGLFVDTNILASVGRTIAGSLNTSIQAALSFGETLDWSGLGTQIANSINTFFNTFDFGKLGKTLYTWADGLLNAMGSAISNVDWTNFGKAIGDFLANIDFVKLATDFSNVAKSLISGISTAIKSVDFEELGKAIGEFVANIDFVGLAKDLGSLALSLLKGLAEAFSGITDTAPLEAAIISIILGLKFAGSFGGLTLSGALGSALGTALNGQTIPLGKIGLVLGLGAATYSLAGSGEDAVSKLVGDIEAGIVAFIGAKILFKNNPIALKIAAAITVISASWDFGEEVGRNVWGVIWGDQEEANEYFSMSFTECLKYLFDADWSEVKEGFRLMFQDFFSTWPSAQEILNGMIDTGETVTIPVSLDFQSEIEAKEQVQQSVNRVTGFINLAPLSEDEKESVKNTVSEINNIVEENLGKGTGTNAGNKVKDDYFDALKPDATSEQKMNSAKSDLQSASEKIFNIDLTAKGKEAIDSVTEGAKEQAKVSDINKSTMTLLDKMQSPFAFTSSSTAGTTRNSLVSNAKQLLTDVVNALKPTETQKQQVFNGSSALESNFGLPLQNTDVKSKAIELPKLTVEGATPTEEQKKSMSGFGTGLANPFIKSLSLVDSKTPAVAMLQTYINNSQASESQKSTIYGYASALATKFKNGAESVDTTSSGKKLVMSIDSGATEQKKSSTLNTIASGLVNLFSGGWTWGLNNYNLTGQGKQAVKDTESGAKSEANKSSMNSTGVTLISQLIGGMNSKLPEAAGTINAQQGNWYSSGMNLVLGLQGGINEKWGSNKSQGLIKFIISLANGLSSALKSAFGIKSPSRVWKGIGKFLPQGLALGIEDEEDVAIKETVKFADSISRQLSDSLVAENPITTWQAEMQDISVDLSSRNEMVLNTASLSRDIADGINGSARSQNELLKQQNNLLTGILNKKSGITESEIYQSVRRSNRNNYLNTGVNALSY